jgi:DivIVA domain-containing protein
MSEPVAAEQIARKDFPLSFRGFDQNEVRAYLAQVAGQLSAGLAREEELLAHIERLESVAPTDVAALDEEAIEAALGREATRILHAAREAAAEIRANAESILAESHAEADKSTAAIRAEVTEALTALREDTERRATAILDESRARAAEIVVDANRERDRVLADLDRLTAARDRLAATFETVQRALATDDDDAPDVVVAPAVVDPAVLDDPFADAFAEPESEPEPVLEPEPQPAPAPAPLTLVPPPPDATYEGVRIIRPEPEPAPEPEPEPESEPAPVAVEEPEREAEGEADEGAVDGLFARLRADRAGKVQRAEAVLSRPAEGDGLSRPAEGESAPEPVPEQQPIGEPVLLEPDRAVLAARDDALVGDEKALVRSLKRALADEQNEVLDRLRRLKGAPTAVALLPDRAVHEARYDAVLGSGVAAAASAGGSAAGGKGGAAAPVAAELGRSLAVDLRTRVERAVEEAGGDVETLAEAISSAYREWKTARVEPLARDAITAGFAAGTYAASSGTLRWVVDPAEGGCPDCDDNVLAGPTAKGSAFPTGQLHPPAHAGCRCVVVSA